MPELEEERRTTAGMKMSASANFARQLDEFINDLRGGKKLVDYDRFYAMLRGLKDPVNIGEWVKVLRWCEQHEKVKKGDLELDFHPSRNPRVWEKFIRHLLREANSTFQESKDMLSLATYMAGPPQYRGETSETSLTDIYEMRARQRRRRK
ncbi:MAG: hypothetical protein V3U52_01225 [Thermoplasmata archaeon]